MVHRGGNACPGSDHKKKYRCLKKRKDKAFDTGMCEKFLRFIVAPGTDGPGA